MATRRMKNTFQSVESNVVMKVTKLFIFYKRQHIHKHTRSKSSTWIGVWFLSITAYLREPVRYALSVITVILLITWVIYKWTWFNHIKKRRSNFGKLAWINLSFFFWYECLKCGLRFCVNEVNSFSTIIYFLFTPAAKTHSHTSLR